MARTIPRAAMRPDTVTLRRIEAMSELEACVELQRDTWGRDFSGCVPAAVMLVAAKVGGVVGGAFDAAGHLKGFVFGITGVVNGRPLHWSHMLAVRESSRGAGLGVRLKLFQRRLLLEAGVDTARWTFDPLVARNAHVNLNRLGATVVDYIENMYGDSNSALHKGLGTDRFVVEWRLNDPAVERVVAGAERPDFGRFAATPVVPGPPSSFPKPPVRIEIPADIHALLERTPDAAAQWRARTREAFVSYLRRGARVAAFHRDPDDRCFYGLQPADDPL